MDALTPALGEARHEHAPSRPAALLGCLEAFRRVEAVARLAQERGAFPGAGAHLRHALEHLRALLDGLEHDCVDYAARPRAAELETDHAAFQAALAALMADLSDMPDGTVTRVISVIDVVAPGIRGSVSSTVARELSFTGSHALHHLALVACVLERAGLVLPKPLYTAWSTQDHEARTRRSSP